MPPVEAKKRINRSVRGLRILVGYSRAELEGGQAVRTAALRRTGHETKTGETVLGSLAFRPDVLVSGFKADRSGTGVP